MNKICLIARNFDTYFIRKLIEEVGEERLIRFNPWEMSSLPSADCYLVRTSGIYRDDKDLEFLNKLSSEAKIINSLASLKRFRQKETQYQFFREEKLPHLSWLNLASSDSFQIEKFLKSITATKVLMKPNSGQGGWGISVHEKKKFLEFWKTQTETKDTDYLLQPYVEKKIEYRLFFIGKNFKVLLERTPSNGEVANFAQGGEAKVVSIPSQLLKPLQALIDKSTAQYGAVDFFLTSHGLILLELNTTPGIEQLEGLAGPGFIRMILNYLP